MFVSCTNETEQVIATCTNKYCHHHNDSTNQTALLDALGHSCALPACDTSSWTRQNNTSMFTSKRPVTMGIFHENLAQ